MHVHVSALVVGVLLAAIPLLAAVSPRRRSRRRVPGRFELTRLITVGTLGVVLIVTALADLNYLLPIVGAVVIVSLAGVLLDRGQHRGHDLSG